MLDNELKCKEMANGFQNPLHSNLFYKCEENAGKKNIAHARKNIKIS